MCTTRAHLAAIVAAGWVSVCRVVCGPEAMSARIWEIGTRSFAPRPHGLPPRKEAKEASPPPSPLDAGTSQHHNDSVPVGAFAAVKAALCRYTEAGGRGPTVDTSIGTKCSITSAGLLGSRCEKSRP